MFLGNFDSGETVRLPLHIVADGGIPITDATAVKVSKIILPGGASDSNFPKNMVLADQNFSVYYTDYKAKAVGNYIVIYSFNLDGEIYTSMDTFYVSPPSGMGTPYARPVQFISS